ncbi:hypothetical protein BH09ACT10_BH09ACT10_05380 [soil metagenome]
MNQPKADFRKTLDSYQARQHEFRIVDVPPMQYLMIDGHGDPNTSGDFSDAIATLYPVAYKLKFASKKDLGKTVWNDFTIASGPHIKTEISRGAQSAFAGTLSVVSRGSVCVSIRCRCSES